MKIILSRKGFDASYGGKPSPIFPDGTFCSLPIPEDEQVQHSICYNDIQWNDHNLGKVVRDLTKGRIREHRRVHLDPDLNPQSLARSPDWRPLFGQVGAAESHLRNQGVTAGDVFLFFGWFRAVARVNQCYRYVKSAPDLHVLFGWLQIESRLRLDVGEALPDWANYHPHVFRSGPEVRNTLYLSQPRLTLPTVPWELPGAGVFREFSSVLQLTAATVPTRGLWLLPAWFYPAGRASCLSYHSHPSRWQLTDHGVLLKTVGRGQEFVLDCQDYPEALGWLGELFHSMGHAPSTLPAG